MIVMKVKWKWKEETLEGGEEVGRITKKNFVCVCVWRANVDVGALFSAFFRCPLMPILHIFLIHCKKYICSMQATLIMF